MVNIEQQVNDVMDQIESETPTVSDAPIPRDDHNNTGFNEYEDGDLVEVEFGSNPTEIVADNTEDLGRILVTYFKRAYGNEWYKKHGSHVPSTVFHEWQHGKVMEDVGIEEIRYGVDIFRNYKRHEVDGKTIFVANWDSIAYTTTAEPFTLEKVLYALIFAYPTEPSGGDLQSVQEIGYRDPRDVYERSLAVQGIPLIKPRSLK